MTRRAAACLGAWLAAAAPCRAAGQRPFEFLFFDAGARAVGLGGAYTSVASDAGALRYNPAGLGAASQNEVMAMHNRYFQQVAQDTLAVSAGGWGLAFDYVDMGRAQRTTVSNPEGSGLAPVEARAWTAAGGYGESFPGGLALGVAVKYLEESIAGFERNAAALDAGLLYRPGFLRGLSLGAALQNAGPPARYQGATEQLPLSLRGGVSYELASKSLPLLFSVDALRREEETRFFGGVELVLAGMLPLRLGWNGLNEAGRGLTAGAGWRLHAFSVDYAFADFGALGAAHRMSLSWRWGGKPVERKAERKEEEEEVRKILLNVR